MADDTVNPIRFGIMGCAKISRKLSRAIQIAPNSTLQAVASRSIEKAKKFVDKYGLSDSVKLYGSYNELLDDPCVDAVYMPLPTSLHLEWAVLAAQRKKHVLLEKPTALNMNQLDQILEACQSNGVQFMDSSMWYHHPRTAKIKDLLFDSQLFGQIRSIHSSSTFMGTSEFLENDIRVKPDLDSLGALGDTGWYCIGVIIWAMNQNLPTTVVALPDTAKNQAGIILSCSATLYWQKEETLATFHCSFLEHESMDVSISASNGSLHLKDFIVPFEESSASFKYTSKAKLVDLHIGWNAQPKEVHVGSELPQAALMVQEFARLVKGIKTSGLKPDGKWAEISGNTQRVLDAVKKSIDLGFEPVYI